MSWTVEIDGLEYEPVPENWIEHGVDRTGEGPQCLAVSVALLRETTLKIRYVHPEYDTVGAMFYPAVRREGVTLPDPSGWSRSVNAARLEPVSTLHAPGCNHLATLWEDRVADVLDSPERFVAKQPITDGGTRVCRVCRQCPPASEELVDGLCADCHAERTQPKYVPDGGYNVDGERFGALDADQLLQMAAEQCEHPRARQLIRCPECGNHPSLANPTSAV